MMLLSAGFLVRSIGSANASTPEKVVATAIKGMQQDKLDIYPGFAGFLKIMSRIAPKLILGQTSKVGGEWIYQ